MDILKSVFHDICAGYSTFQYKENVVFIKHLNQQDSYLLDLESDKYFQKALSHNVPTRAQKLEELEKSGEWTKSNDRELKEREDYIKNLHVTYSKLVYESQKKQIKLQIEEAEKKKLETLYKKLSLMGVTCEKFAEDKLNEYYIYFSLFKNRECTDRLFTYEEFDELDGANEIPTLINLYSESLSQITTENIKKIAISNFFTSIFYLCGDDLSVFFEKPILDLTFNQISLLNFGGYYKKLMQNHNIPAEYLSDPAQIEDFVVNKRNASDILSKNQHDNVAVVGSKKDMKKFNNEPAFNPVMDKLKKDGSIGGVAEAIKTTGG